METRGESDDVEEKGKDSMGEERVVNYLQLEH